MKYYYKKPPIILLKKIKELTKERYNIKKIDNKYIITLNNHLNSVFHNGGL
jgi:hypothetical protein